MLIASATGMSDALRRRILGVRDEAGADPWFADRLLEGVRRIESDFDGGERERLLSLVSETLDRHLEIRQSSARARRALAQLKADQERIVQLLRLLAAAPGGDRTLH